MKMAWINEDKSKYEQMSDEELVVVFLNRPVCPLVFQYICNERPNVVKQVECLVSIQKSMRGI